MGLPKALGMYSDIKEVFDVCLAQGPLRLTFPTPAQALQFRQRGYYYRKLLHEKQLEALGLPVANTFTPYDSIKMTIAKDEPLVVRVAEVKLSASIVLESGEPVRPPETFHATRAEPEDDLADLAARFAKDLEG